ncbi:CHAP domain-containing protein [Streptomyces deccanensis]|uniref:CHAP domain-containing protein n=1 Tax=Streptomyces deccanensis TaxID=424188 RepID=UPI001EFA423D|nr:CHAP domain-containing protein [Streptomyces deccanensis]ULR55548.1 CHAP domain-containing protein [Streptomyces deccanensis]
MTTTTRPKPVPAPVLAPSTATATAPALTPALIARTARLVVNLAIALAVMTAALVMGTGTSHAATRAQIAAIAEAEVGHAEGNGSCLKYGPCTTTPWCAYFASWVWRSAGVSPVPTTAVARGVGLWGQQQGLFSSRPAGGIGDPEPGDIVVYGAPANASGGHVSIVTAVHANGTITTVDGNYGDKVARRVIDPRTARSGADSLLISGYVKPKGVQAAGGDLHVTTTVGGRPFHNLRYANGSWSGANVSDPSGGITDTAEAGASNGDMHVLTVAGGQLLHTLRYANGSWSGAQVADGNGAISKVAAATTSNGDLHVLTLVQGRSSTTSATPTVPGTALSWPTATAPSARSRPPPPPAATSTSSPSSRARSSTTSGTPTAPGAEPGWPTATAPSPTSPPPGCSTVTYTS